MTERPRLETHSVAAEADGLFRELFPICRSITGEGVRKSLKILSDFAGSFELHEVPSGTKAFDWVIPREWNVRGATLKTADGKTICDFAENNVHLVSYSVPFEGKLSFAELDPHLHSLPELPEAIPYRTSYYKENWGFCISHNLRETLNPNAEYEIKIDSELRDGSLTYADAILTGSSGREYLISSYCCHPSLANDNLSGPILTALLFRIMKGMKLRHSYRFVICPETIGAIAYLHRNSERMRESSGGLVVTTVAGPGPLGYKESFLGDHTIDRAIRKAFADLGVQPIRYPFAPDGSDERQYSSPGFRIPVASITKDKYYEYDYYHTSLDDLNFVSGECLVKTLQVYLDTIMILEGNRSPKSRLPDGEVQLGKRGLYPQTGGAQKQSGAENDQSATSDVDLISWILFLADGKNDMMAIADRAGASFSRTQAMCEKLLEADVLEYV